MATFQSDPYADVMVRSQNEKTRLNRQYDVITRALGWTVHPSIAERLHDNSKIADVGTGTAAFLASLAKTYPRAQLDGFDISSIMFPSADMLPANVQLHLADAKVPFIPSLHGLYDLVHVRYLVASLEEPDWEVVLANVLQLLKPGGAIQWEEPDTCSLQWVRGKTTSTTETVNMLRSRFQNAIWMRRASYGWNTLPGIMRRAGLRVQTDVVSSDRVVEDRKLLSEASAMILLEQAEMMAARGDPSALSSSEIQQAARELRKDLDSGAYVRHDVYSAIGFKHDTVRARL
ncbi:MAG: hypothetical protein Q9162_007027 [Coniocarpon cinnabarinum]